MLTSLNGIKNIKAARVDPEDRKCVLYVDCDISDC